MTQRQVVWGFSGLVVLAAIGGGLLVEHGLPSLGGGSASVPLDMQIAETSLPPSAVADAPDAQPVQLAAAPAPAAPAAAVQRELPQSQDQVELSYAPLVKQVTPAVVNVYATKTEQGFQSPFQGDPFFSQLFGGQMFPSRPQTSQSLGSGVIVDPKGVIITNSHVVNGADEIQIALSGGREYPVKVLLDDTKSDLAVLQMQQTGGKTFPALPFADSEDVQVGDIVLAIGNPFGVGQTVTSGIVSGLGRSGVETGNFDYFIQTDAAINPGNSGGALVNMQGRLVGINTAIFTRSGGSVGIGFAIPANMAHTVAEAGEKGGAIVRPWFGAQLQEVTSDIADSLNIDPPHGALITEVAPGSPAANAGLKSGDAIITLDGVDVDAPQGFDFRFATKELGSKSNITFMRAGKPYQVAVEVAAAPGAGTDQTALISGNTRFAGTTVSLLTPAVAQDMSLPFDSKGVVVTDVAEGSAAEAMGLQKGDVIVAINGTPINDLGTFKSLVSTEANGWQIVLQRNGQTIQSYVSG
ncbi:MAG TPA: DegQ family serine endoprotease [Devosia sp.]|nr:DegQ family serine endoprotease [Devosia sp.]